MRIAVFSDMHGNDFAFEKVQADVARQGVDASVCLGDAIQGGPQPAAAAARLRGMNCAVVMGNADSWLLTGKDSGREPIPAERLKKMHAIREWSLAQLNDADRAFIAGFQPTVTIQLRSGRELLCFHGSPTDFDDVILPITPQEEFLKYLGAFRDNILCGGHTHTQQMRRCGENYYFNPGSVGFAFDALNDDKRFHADAWAEYAILQVENDSSSVEFRRLPYALSELIDVYHRSGRPFAQDAIAEYSS